MEDFCELFEISEGVFISDSDTTSDILSELCKGCALKEEVKRKKPTQNMT